jgi:hypothetical protein
MASMSNQALMQAPVLNGLNHSTWVSKMKVFLSCHECLEIVEDGVTLLKVEDQDALDRDARRTYTEVVKKNTKSLWLIFQGVDESIFPKIEGKSTAKGAWDTLMNIYQGTKKVKTVKLQTLRRNFETMSMKDTETVDQFMTSVKHLVHQIRSQGEDIPDQKIVEKVLRSLPEKFNMVVVAIKESKDLTMFTIDQLMGSLLSHEARLQRENTSLESSFQMKATISKGRGHGGRSRGRGRGWRGRSQPQNACRSHADPDQSHARSSYDRGRGRGHTQEWVDKS